MLATTGEGLELCTIGLETSVNLVVAASGRVLIATRNEVVPLQLNARTASAAARENIGMIAVSETGFEATLPSSSDGSRA